MESLNKFVIPHDPEQAIGLNEMSHERREEILNSDELVSREEFGWDVMNNFYLFFVQCDQRDDYVKRATESGWFNKYLETHSEQYELLSELLTSVHLAAGESAGNLLEAIKEGKEKTSEYYDKYDKVFLPAATSVMDQMYEQYVGMFNAITEDDMKNYPHRKSRAGLLGH